MHEAKYRVYEDCYGEGRGRRERIDISVMD